MKTQHMNHFRLPVGIRNKETTALDNAHRDAALDEALRESFPASDPIAVSFTPPRARDIAQAPDRNSQIENEQRRMAGSGVTFDGHSYRYREYRYDLLSDALSYARLDPSRSTYQKAATTSSQWIEPEKPTEAEQQQMARLAITFDGKHYRYRDYRYDRLVDAIDYAELTRVTGVM